MNNKQPKLMSRKKYDLWRKKIPKGNCIFCDWINTQIVLKEFKKWVWIANLSPYWKYHTFLIPKRHFVEFSKMTREELKELTKVYDYVIKKYKNSKLLWADRKRIKNYVFFWRFRENNFDPISNANSLEHFHIHSAPDRDHLWDPILDKDAHKADLKKIME